ncbi:MULTISPECIES: hypothetical protein [unclassified Modestobacter]|uniref:hypothetical protein n=1 Tax=unclassified Modestobacter TaxID=2643866 RepID=UPI0022AAB154|nr:MULTISPECIES: hypothetical protein [unclassified Modestobacter]MCZ2823327.1 hypothetical protein [Modestobacter sp. VKM Ac-2981]MCZ2851572.1 hypothetical protein [Modestobacter sp. VKM Ac-2982]
MSRTTTFNPVLLITVALVLSGWVLASPARACSCVGLTTAEQFERADAVFTGQLISREVRGGGSSTDAAVHLFSVDTVFKGTVHTRQGVVSAASGASCGLELSGDGPFLVFADRLGEQADDSYTAGLCDGTAPATPDLLTEIRDLGAAAVPADPLPGSAGTDPPPEQLPLVGVLVAGLAGLVLLTAVLVRRSRRRGA